MPQTLTRSEFFVDRLAFYLKAGYAISDARDWAIHDMEDQFKKIGPPKRPKV